MASSSTEDKLQYLLCVLKYADLSSLDYRAIALEMGINTSHNAQRRFKAIVESAGFKLVNKQVVDSSGRGATASSAPAKRTSIKSGKGKSSRGKKRPAEDAGGDEVEVGKGANGDGDANCSEGSRKKRARSTTVTADPAAAEGEEEKASEEDV